MKGSLTERQPGVWLLRVYTGHRDTRGHPLQRSRTFRGSQRQAQTALARFVTEIDAQRQEDSGIGVTVGRLLDRWLEHIATERTAYTLKSYRQKIEGRLKPAFGRTLLVKLQPASMDAQYRAWLEEGLSPATVRQLHAIVSAALQQAFRWGWIESNPARRVKPPSVTRGPVEVPTVAELRTLITEAEAAGDLVLATAIGLAAVTGCRRGELCALRWSDIRAGVVTVGRSLSAVGGDWSMGGTKTKKTRRLALGDLGIALVERRQDQQRVFAHEAGVELDRDPFLLSRAARGHLPCLPDGLTHGFSRLCARLGYPYHFHQLRHWAATVAISEGHDIRTVAGRLGHADASTTLRIYAHVIEARDSELADSLGKALGKALLPG